LDNEPIVFIVDDDPAVCRAMTALIGAMGSRAQAFSSAEEFLGNVDPAQPGCLLLDVRMPGINGLELMEQLAQRGFCLPVIMISAHGDVPMVVRAMRAGALTFLEKPCRDQELWEAIQEALIKDRRDRRQMAHIAKIRRRLLQLTPGELVVLKMLVEGKPNKAIAAALGLSVRTIEVRRSKVMKKMKADSLAKLIQLALTVSEVFANPHSNMPARRCRCGNSLVRKH